MKSFRLKTRSKLRSSKLRKGGNRKSSGLSSSGGGSSKIDWGNLKRLIYQHYEIQDLIKSEAEPLLILEFDMKDVKKKLLSIFMNNAFDLNSLSYPNGVKELLKLIIGTDADVVKAYANSYLNIDESNLMITEIIQELKNEYQSEIDKRDKIRDKDTIKNFEKKISILNIVLGILLPNDALMVDRIRAVKRGEEPSQVSKNSDHLGLPGPPYKSIMENLYGPNYRHESSNPFNYNDMISNLNGSSSSSSSDEKGHPDNSSSSEKGGRRRSRKLRGRKLRKTMRRK